MVSEIQPEQLANIASELQAAANRLGDSLGSCSAALPGAGAEVSAEIAGLLADEQQARTCLAEGIAALAGDLERRAEIVHLSDRRWQ